MVRAVDFSPDGTLIATACQDGVVRVWDSRSGQPVFQSVNVEDIVAYVEFSPDGKKLLGATLGGSGKESSIAVWDVGTGNILSGTRTGGCLTSTSRTVSFGPTGNDVFAFVAGIHGLDGLSCCSKGWSLTTGNVVNQTNPFFFVLSCARSRDCSRVAGSGTAGNEVVILDVVKGAEVTRIHQTSTKTSNGFSFSPNGDMLAWCTEQQAFVHNAKTGTGVCGPLQLDDEGHVTCFNPLGDILAVGTKKGIRLWSVPNGKPIGGLIDLGGYVTGLEFSADGSCVAASSQEGNMGRVWDAATGKPLTAPLSLKGWVHDISLSPDGKRVVTAGHDNVAAVWSITPDPLNLWPAMIVSSDIDSMRAQSVNSAGSLNSLIAIDVLEIITELNKSKE